jgi:lipopolysaccharide/colanic/teichoic acid biosynthesis glycosyltransferase
VNDYLPSHRKRALDIIAAIVGLMVLAVIALPVAVAILFANGWPVTFRQRRIGLDGREFTITKLRTMRDGDVYPLARWLRHTHLDEMPQWWSVLRGDMSAVGPRPHMVDEHMEVSRTNPLFSVRLRVKPGITGLAQLTASSTDMVDKLGADMLYMASASLRCDIGLLARTAWPLRGVEAVTETHETATGRLETHAD